MSTATATDERTRTTLDLPSEATKPAQPLSSDEGFARWANASAEEFYGLRREVIALAARARAGAR